MRAFIVRPFGEKNGVDFDAVDRRLIQPAVRKAGIIATTTEPLVAAGNIREDMFRELLVADLVIADISVHNANVYYELGIRHALRDRATVLIRCRVKEHDVPFDLRTDRYVVYDRDKPAAAVPLLTEALHQTIASSQVDSPVYRLLPDLERRDVSSFVPVPRGFQSAVETARRDGDLACLGLLGEELTGLDWRTSGRRLVGRAQLALHDFAGARVTWERVLARLDRDPEALLRLGTVYKYQDRLSRAQDVLDRLLEQTRLPSHFLSEGRALLGALIKLRWRRAWQSHARLEARRRAALDSALLYDALDAYRAGYLHDLNTYYPGLNALALTTIVAGLAELEPRTWAARHASPEAARAALAAIDDEWAELAGAVHQAIAADGARLACRHESDVWHDLSVADHALLTGASIPTVRTLYAQARDRACARVVDGQPLFALRSAAEQLAIFVELGLLEDEARAALDALGAAIDGGGRAARRGRARPPGKVAGSRKGQQPQPGAPPPAGSGRPDRQIIVFTGHRIDDDDRPEPRFPNVAANVDAAQAAIRAAIERVVAHAKANGLDPVEGVAGVASGGDILFHEACRALGLETTLLFAIPPQDYIVASVQAKGGEIDWVARFRKLVQDTPAERIKVLGETKELPSWLAPKAKRGREVHYDVWRRNNLWTLHSALDPRADTTLIAFWNGQSGDGPGGTKDMVELARQRGVQTIILSPDEVFARAKGKGGAAVNDGARPRRGASHGDANRTAGRRTGGGGKGNGAASRDAAEPGSNSRSTQRRAGRGAARSGKTRRKRGR